MCESVCCVSCFVNSLRPHVPHCGSRCDVSFLTFTCALANHTRFSVLLRQVWVIAVLCVLGSALAADSEATVDTEVDSEVEAENVVYLRQVTKSSEQTNEWSKFVDGHHAELIEMDVCERWCRVVAITLIFTRVFVMFYHPAQSVFLCVCAGVCIALDLWILIYQTHMYSRCLCVIDLTGRVRATQHVADGHPTEWCCEDQGMVAWCVATWKNRLFGKRLLCPCIAVVMLAHQVRSYTMNLEDIRNSEFVGTIAVGTPPQKMDVRCVVCASCFTSVR
jgi:hypothetical protein